MTRRKKAPPARTTDTPKREPSKQLLREMAQALQNCAKGCERQVIAIRKKLKARK